MRIRQPLPQPYTAQTGMQVSWKVQQLRAGVKQLWSNLRVRAADDCRETGRGDVREEIMVGNACGGKPGSHGSQLILLSHACGWGHHYSLSLSLSLHTPASEAEQRGWSIKRLRH